MYQVVSFIDKIRNRLKRREGNRRDCEPGRTYSDWLIIKIWTICMIRSWSVNVFYEKLERSGREFRRRWKLPADLPCRSVAYDRMRRSSFFWRLREFFHECTREALRLGRPEANRTLAVDLTRLDAPLSDALAAWGFSSSKGAFWGYKLGLIVNEDGVVLAMRLRRADTNENTTSLPLLREARKRLQEVGLLGWCECVTGDKAYDAEKNFQFAEQQMKAIFVCPGKKKKKKKVKRPYTREYQARVKYPFRTRGIQFTRTDEGRRIYSRRSEVERVNGQLKDAQFRIAEIPRMTRGVRRVTRWCIGKLIYYTLACCVNYSRGRYNRSLKAYAA